MNDGVPAIACSKLSKRYGRSPHYALKDLTLQVHPGEVYGFLGANGAGKSTAIRTLLNFLQPTSGSAQILGRDVVRDTVNIKRHIGYLSGEVALYQRLTGRQLLRYMAELQPPKHNGYLAELVKQFGAELNQPIATLSKGNRQKLGLIQAFMHEPEVLILDEPTSGLDPLMQEVFFGLVSQVKARGAGVFVSSHNFAEVQRMCDRVGFIRHGALVAEQKLADLATAASHTFTITFAAEVPLYDLKRIKGAEVSSPQPSIAKVSLSGELTPLLRVLANHHVLRLDQQEVNLEEQFLRFYDRGRA